VGYRPRKERLSYWVLLIATWHSILLFSGKRNIPCLTQQAVISQTSP